MPFILTQYAQGVLHYSPLEFGLASVVMPVTAALGSIAGQAIATRGGLRSVATAGLALTGLGLPAPVPGLRRRQLLRRHLLRAAAVRPGARGGLRRGLDRLAGRRRRGRRRARIGAQQLVVPDRRRRSASRSSRPSPCRRPTAATRSPRSRTASSPRSRPRSSSPRSGCWPLSPCSASSGSRPRLPQANPPRRKTRSPAAVCVRGGRAVACRCRAVASDRRAPPRSGIAGWPARVGRGSRGCRPPSATP